MNDSIINKENAHLTNNSIDEYIKILKSYSEGKKLQFRVKGSKTWYSAETPSFDFSTNEYRIKPTSYYRPYINGNEAFTEIHEHTPSGWLYNMTTMLYEQILCIGDNGIYTRDNDYSYEQAFNTFIYPNDEKFGIKLDNNNNNEKI